MQRTKEQRHYQRQPAFRTGIVAQLDVPNVRVRVTFPDRSNIQSWWLRVAVRGSQNNKDFWMPDLGEQVICLMDECDEAGVVIGSLYSQVDTPPPSMTADKRHTTFQDGTTVEYDRALHVFDGKFNDAAEFKYDAVAHAMTINLPAGATMSIAIASGGSVAYDASGNWKIEPGAGKVLIADVAGGTQPVARVGDTVHVTDPDDGTLTGTIVTGSSKVSAGG